MKKFFDSRRELVSSGPGSIAGGGGAGSGSGGSFIGRVFTIGRYQVTVEEIIAEGDLCGSLLCRLTLVTQPPLTRSTLRTVFPLCYEDGQSKTNEWARFCWAVVQLLPT